LLNPIAKHLDSQEYFDVIATYSLSKPVAKQNCINIFTKKRQKIYNL